ncbi:MAG: histidine phosphatase family protein [Anaerosomatales bacterium]|nr:histidine phosphatase family protein [Coriobacteriia bacterium]MDI6692920.1 histidine phosphatase family protein [Anaerosomatales bacterium]MDI6844072.1 histidine phosphatase family protein [Anaerosomatales bacterium]
MPRIFVIRHPETEANVERRFVGRTDSRWTERGREQAKAIHEFVHGLDPDVVLSSPSARALKAAHVATPCAVPLRVVEELREIDFGAAEGLTFDEARALGLAMRYVPSTPQKGAVSQPDASGQIAPGGESWEEFIARIEFVRRELLGIDGTVCVFTHGGTGRALIAALLSLPPEAMWSFALPTGGVAEIVADDGRATLVRLFSPLQEE